MSAIMGIGGGFVMIPAMIYLLRVPTGVVIGTSLFQIVFVAAFATILHAVQNKTVDVVLAAILMAGGVIGAQFGTIAGERLKNEQMRVLLAALVLIIAGRMGYDLVTAPADLFSLSTAVRGGMMYRRICSDPPLDVCLRHRGDSRSCRRKASKPTRQPGRSRSHRATPAPKYWCSAPSRTACSRAPKPAPTMLWSLSKARQCPPSSAGNPKSAVFGSIRFRSLCFAPELLRDCFHAADRRVRGSCRARRQ